MGTVADAGAVNVLYGSAGGLTAAGRPALAPGQPRRHRRAEAGDLFGSALAAGDFDGDGFDDLAVGVPDEDVGDVERRGRGQRALRLGGRA